MKANTKYTALEILTLSGIEKPEEKFGKVRVRIAGIAGITKPDHLIKLQAGTKEFDVIVGEETKTVKIEGDEETSVVSEGARVSLDNKGVEAIKKFEDLAKVKAEAKKEVKENK